MVTRDPLPWLISAPKFLISGVEQTTASYTPTSTDDALDQAALVMVKGASDSQPPRPHRRKRAIRQPTYFRYDVDQGFFRRLIRVFPTGC